MTRQIAFLLLNCGLVLQLAHARQPDHLLPVDTSEDIQYRRVIQEKLGKTAFDCGRIIIMPAFDAERSLSIYAVRTKNQPDRYQLTCIIAKESLWGASDMGLRPDKASGVKTERVDQVIPSAIAKAVKAALEKMLTETSALRPSEQPAKIVAEGVIKEYVLPSTGGKIARGEISKYPPTTPKLKRLEALTLDLLAYCKASETERDKLAKRIERNAKSLQR